MQTNKNFTKKIKKRKKRRTHHVLESWCKKIEIKNTFPYIIILNACTKTKYKCMSAWIGNLHRLTLSYLWHILKIIYVKHGIQN
jgi:hypothetical protein